MSRPTGYSVIDYGRMITCEPRMSAFAKALREAVTPGCRVIDIGAGTGIFAILACQYGAGAVAALEPDDAIELLPELARANGCRDRITIFKGMSQDYRPDAKANVVVSDLRGALPLYESHLPTIIDARERLLAPGGTLIPARDRLSIALVHAPDQRQKIDEPWKDNGLDLELRPAHRFAANSWCKVAMDAESLLSKPSQLATIDYYSVSNPDLTASAALTVSKPGSADGLLIWFDCELAPGIEFSNAPGQPALVYGQAFFPFETAIEVNVGDRVEVDFTARLIDGAYLYGWSGVVKPASSGRREQSFRQSSFAAKIATLADVQDMSDEGVPQPNPEVLLGRACLDLFDGQRTVAQIAEALQLQFPQRFATARESLVYVSKLHRRFRKRGGQIIRS